jgi:hypothetical protein
MNQFVTFRLGETFVVTSGETNCAVVKQYVAKGTGGRVSIAHVDDFGLSTSLATSQMLQDQKALSKSVN